MTDTDTDTADDAEGVASETPPLEGRPIWNRTPSRRPTRTPTPSLARSSSDCARRTASTGNAPNRQRGTPNAYTPNW